MNLKNVFVLLLTTCTACAKTYSMENLPCMNIPFTVEVIECMSNLAESKRKEYNREYHLYVKAIMTPEDRPYDKKHIYMLAKEAKKSWDVYLEKECLSEASLYEEGNYGFNDNYHSCLIDRYTARIAYYKKRKNRL